MSADRLMVLFARPGVGALTLALLFGMFALIYGISQVSGGIQLRQTGATVHSVLRKRPEPGDARAASAAGRPGLFWLGFRGWGSGLAAGQDITDAAPFLSGTSPGNLAGTGEKR